MYNNYVIGPGKTQSCETDHIEIADFFNVTLIWFLSTGVPTIKGLVQSLMSILLQFTEMVY